MSVFDSYARYYDLLNKDKDYSAETRYVAKLIDRFGSAPCKLLDIGCGTGRHAELLFDEGFDMVGVDRSEAMVALAKAHHSGMEFHVGDICNFQLGRRFQAVTALFHVFSYLTEENQLRAALKNIHEHLEPGGLMIFDCWHGPAVVHQKPELRIRRIEDGDLIVVRIAEPKVLPELHRVDVSFQVFVKEKETWNEFSELHPMRYLFQPEIETLLVDSGFELLKVEEWMTGNAPSVETWCVVYIARLVGM
ncbi:MAG: class I SAM-dependent methyltransferase [Xanthomonadales bacterium]|jgi:SAM-dependent methyltransferase|nr:class I SAM-dependent methyltransferase [Xanthomonadales bacterium]